MHIKFLLNKEILQKGNNCPRDSGLSPYFFLYWYTLLISMCLQKLMNIHRCIFKILEKEPALGTHTQILQRAITPRELAPSPYFFLCRYTLLISMCLQKLMNIHCCFIKILGNKPVSRTDTKFYNG